MSTADEQTTLSAPDEQVAASTAEEQGADRVSPTSPDPVPALEEQVAALEAHVAALEVEVASLRSQRDSAWLQLETLRHSLSWRLTGPLRRVVRLRVR